MYSYNPYCEEYLAHYGVLGMKWGIRRYQPYTKGQKGVFKGLKKDYKKQKKVLKAQRKYYQAQGDELAATNINQQIKKLTKSYNKTVDEVTKEFNKENWETYKEKVASTGSMKEVDAIKRELSGEQLWRANERFKAQNEFERTKYGVDEKILKMRNVAEKMNAGVSIAKSAIGAWDIARTIHNMNTDDLDYKPLSREATADAATKRIQQLKDVKDPTRLPTFSGARDTKKSYAESYYEKNNKGDNSNKGDKSNKGDNSKSQTYTTPKGTTETASKKEEPKWQTYNSLKESGSSKGASEPVRKASTIADLTIDKSVSTPFMQRYKEALSFKPTVGEKSASSIVNNFDISDYKWSDNASSKALKLSTKDIGFTIGNDGEYIFSGTPHNRMYNAR